MEISFIETLLGSGVGLISLMTLRQFYALQLNAINTPPLLLFTRHPKWNSTLSGMHNETKRHYSNASPCTSYKYVMTLLWITIKKVSNGRKKDSWREPRGVGQYRKLESCGKVAKNLILNCTIQLWHEYCQLDSMTHWGIDSTRALKVCLGIWHKDVSSISCELEVHGLDSFDQHVPRMPGCQMIH